MRSELYWITAAPQGRLAIMPRPRAGDWLADEVAVWKAAGIEAVVSLLTRDESVELGLEREQPLAIAANLQFYSYPITDRSVPSSIEDFLPLIKQLAEHLSKQESVAIHCRMGIGRSSLTAACLLVKAGLSPADAFAAISTDRGLNVPDTDTQMNWVLSNAERLRFDGAID